MSWWSTVLGWFGFGGGGVVSAVDDAINLADDVTHEVHDKNQRDSGAAAQRDVTDEATTKTLEAVSAPINTADRDKLWDINKAKFGPTGGKPGK